MQKLSLLIVICLLITCSDEEFLQQYPHTASPVNIFNTESGALLALNGIYDILQSQEAVMRFEKLGIYCSPDGQYTGQPGGGDSPYQGSFQRFFIFSDSRGTYPYWSALYRGLYQCNLLLDILSDTERLVDFDKALLNRIIGETLFLRGLMEFKLLIVFAGMPQLQQDFSEKLFGLPFFDYVPAPEEYYPNRPSLIESWDRVISDFQTAIPMLPRRSEYAIADVGRATKGAAQAMLAKTYLYTENWEKAFEYTEYVINSDEYWLEGETGHSGPYFIDRTSKEGIVSIQVPALKWIWQPEGDNHGGVVFSIQYHADHDMRYPEGQEGSSEPYSYAPRAGLVWDKEINDTVQILTPAWGLYQPSAWFVYTAYKENGTVDSQGDILDPRYKYTIISETDSLPYYFEEDDLRNRYPDSILYDAWYQWPCTGFSQWKYFPDPIFKLDAISLSDYPHDFHYLRFADVLLMAAEAAVQSGNLNAALNYTNRVRQRARNCGDTGYPKDLPAISLEDVYAERRVELIMEGHSFFDLVRTRRIKKELMEAYNSEYATVTHPKRGDKALMQYGNNFIVGKHEIFPIPISEIELSGGSLTQNPGYTD